MIGYSLSCDLSRTSFEEVTERLRAISDRCEGVLLAQLKAMPSNRTTLLTCDLKSSVFVVSLSTGEIWWITKQISP